MRWCEIKKLEIHSSCKYLQTSAEQEAHCQRKEVDIEQPTNMSSGGIPGEEQVASVRQSSLLLGLNTKDGQKNRRAQKNRRIE